LNNLGYDSYLYPYFETYEVNKKNILQVTLAYIKLIIKSLFKTYKTNNSFNSKIYTNNIKSITSYDIVVYPEIVFGNPLNAKNVIRWLLHQPGFHNGKIYYGKGELYFKFNSAIDDFYYSGSKTSKKFLKIIHYPTEYYNTKECMNKREGNAHCLRKGKHKKIQHDLENSILIDGKSHKEVSKIFKSINTFISYDTYTAYSIFASLCGCNSVIIPDDGVTKEEWYPNETDRYGLAYGFKEIKNAKLTVHLVKEHIEQEEKNSIDNVKKFIQEIEIYFKQ
jgi:hypothetical protein